MDQEMEAYYQELAEDIVSQSKYKRKASNPKKMMTVHEMGDLLGIRKTDRYWLVHKNFFETKKVLGKMYVDIASFEKWYANQIKYKKVNGEEPGKELKARSYSVREIAEMLDLTEGVVYDLMKRDHVEVIEVDYWKRIPKEAFEKWYAGQGRYRTKEDREKDADIENATISMPEMATLLGVTRQKVYEIMRHPKYKAFFEVVVVAEKKRITKESFQRFLEGQDRYHLAEHNTYKEVALEENLALANYRRRVLARTNVKKGIGNQEMLTRNEAALLAKVAPNTVSMWCERKLFPVKCAGCLIRIPRPEFEEWLERKKEMEVLQNGINQRTRE